MNIRPIQRLAEVQPPIIPVVGQWVRETPGTLSLGQGMVSYPPPPAALSAIAGFGYDRQDHTYNAPLGDPVLLAMLRDKLLSENGIDCDQGSKLMVTAGSNMAFLNVLMAIADPGDEVILPIPWYFNQEMAARMLGCVPVGVNVSADYQLDLAAIASAITPRTRAIVTISPNNPTGAVYAREDLIAVSQLCWENGLYHISDEAYEYFIYDGVHHFSAGSLPGANAYTISLYSLSKAYGFASWRLGYAVFPESLLSSMLKIQDTNLICPPTITQRAAMGALETGVAYCHHQLIWLREARETVLAKLAVLGEQIQVVIPEGAFYVLLNVKTRMEDRKLAERLIREYRVAVIPGSAFGLGAGCYLRLSFGMLDPQSLEEAMMRLVTGLADCVGG